MSKENPCKQTQMLEIQKQADININIRSMCSECLKKEYRE